MNKMPAERESWMIENGVNVAHQTVIDNFTDEESTELVAFSNQLQREVDEELGIGVAWLLIRAPELPDVKKRLSELGEFPQRKRVEELIQRIENGY